MEEDLYAVLGVSRTATAEAIKDAWRSLARELHPDKNTDPEVVARFKRISAAWNVLGNPDKRLVYDHMGLSAVREGTYEALAEELKRHGQQRQQRTSRESTTARHVNPGRAPNRATADRPPPRQRAPQVVHETPSPELHITFEQAALGGTFPVEVTDRGPCPGCGATGLRASGRPCTRCQGTGISTESRQVPVDVPMATLNGKILRVSGQGALERDGSRAALYVKIRVIPHRYLTREGLNLRYNLVLSAAQAKEGGEHEVPLLGGSTMAQIPADSTEGSVVRLPGLGLPGPRGVNPGDLYVHIRVE